MGVASSDTANCVGSLVGVVSLSAPPSVSLVKSILCLIFSIAA